MSASTRVVGWDGLGVVVRWRASFKANIIAGRGLGRIWCRLSLTLVL